MIDDTFVPTRMKDIRNYKINKAKEQERLAVRESMKYNTHVPAIVRMSNYWLTFCDCGWEAEDSEWAIAFQKRIQHRMGKDEV